MTIMTIEGGIVQVLFTLLTAPLYGGIINKLKARVEGKRGPSIFQPYYDILKLIKKEVIIPEDSNQLFLIAPYLVFAIYVVISFVIPVIMPAPVVFTATVDFLGGGILFTLAAFLKVTGALGSKSNFVALSASRVTSFMFLGEGTLISVFFAVALITGTNNPYITLATVSSLSNYFSLDHLFAAFAFFLLWLFETGKLPVESSGLSEMGMIDEGINYEYSGKLLGLSKWGSYIKQYLLGSVFLNVFLLPFWFFYGSAGYILNPVMMLLKWIILIGVTVIIETSLAKVRLFKIQDYLAIAFTISVLSLILTVIGGFS
ncbi:MAG: respiratory chain complex I subunit 1 family protein [Nitrososphaerota archaeon]|jgi:formate hydrogenlyase subunit 4|nr:respiratory chain complex I subunit 1 family protein [Nitrososphaerota archaeon]MDG6927277.1 respiratory chain complex I subunit 1 family protein [Nitrososphaerota archaeon]MDG6930365.1 respiratory chain complex I subunit 1 family protein [Nitrososphaerota archaeon]MDG6931721.1 respiratory chain complex I subunit 1 family protein [Nitrososphaerota archaeon]MDG6936769.1 respiratory chain complex I subunit 1 family protein [Nitrososphaerota archaeon]